MYSIILATALATTANSSVQWQCSGGGWGWGQWTYCTGCFGNYGCWGTQGCHGCSGCYGTSFPPAAYAPYGASTCMCAGFPVTCQGCYGGWSCYGLAHPAASTVPVIPSTRPSPKFEEIPLPRVPDIKPEIKPESSREVNKRATVVVEVPTDAKVYIDGNLMRSTSARRVFHTPVLADGQTYFYDVRVEIVRDSRTIANSQRVVLNPGQRILATFVDLESRPATARSAEK